MQINWESTINSIFADHLVCPRCSQETDSLVAGYSRRPNLNQYAPRHRNCPRGSDCDARKLIVLCAKCSRSERLHGSQVDSTQILETYMLDCRRDLEESLDYSTEYWRDDFEISDENFDHSLEEVNSNAFKDEMTWRQRLEEEYLEYHRAFRERHQRIPNPGWRAEYVEEIIALGYETNLGE